MYITNRFWLKYGMETDPMEVTTKEHKTFDKAYAYAKRYARGLRFVSCTIETEDGKVLYEIFSHGAEVTTKEHKTFDKAYAYAKRYARGLRFVSCTIETEDGKVLYEIFSHGADEEDCRTEEEKKLMEKEKIIKDMEENYGK